jgi:hypothetical protein
VENSISLINPEKQKTNFQVLHAAMTEASYNDENTFGWAIASEASQGGLAFKIRNKVSTFEEKTLTFLL